VRFGSHCSVVNLAQLNWVEAPVRPDFTNFTNSLLTNFFSCQIVSVVVQGIKHELAFSHQNSGRVFAMSKRILVVDDNADMREIMQVYMGSLGLKVIVARDGVEGIEAANRENPDLIVTDAHMPNLDGVTMVKRLRNQPHFQSVPIVVLTGVGPEMQREAQKAGADRIFIKPVSPSELAAKINELLGGASGG
jgi:two-component system chemotaxis response regulator CheY